MNGTLAFLLGWVVAILLGCSLIVLVELLERVHRRRQRRAARDGLTDVRL